MRIANGSAMDATPTLRDVQSAISRALRHSDASAAARCIIGDGLGAARRLDVYRNTFVGSLTRALQLAFPAVRRLVGDEFFESAAQVFIGEQPPRSAWLDEYGAEFPRFLTQFRPAASVRYLADVARLEWAVNRALHAPDVAALDLGRLAGVDPADHCRVCLVAHPSVSLLTVDYCADVIWRAVLECDDAALARIDPAPGSVPLLVERCATRVDVVRLDAPAWRFMADLTEGLPLDAALANASDIDAPALLAGHLQAGRFVDFKVAGRPVPAVGALAC